MIRSRLILPLVLALLCLPAVRQAHAIPSFARKYHTTCLTCHTVYPVLNPFGEAFRRNGYRFPSTGGSIDTDNIQTETIPLGQDQYKSMFPKSVWPSMINEAIPLSAGVNGTITEPLSSNARAGLGGYHFALNGIQDEFHLWAAGDFDSKLTYFVEATFADDGFDIEHAYLLWNDVLRHVPNHIFNLWVGRLMNPQLTSFGLHSSYLTDTNLPDNVMAGMWGSLVGFDLNISHPDGVEANGIVAHRLDYSLGYLVSSSVAPGITPTSKDVYAHVGFKLGGMTLDGEGAFPTPDPAKPWAESSATLDLFGYHSEWTFANGLGAPQIDVINSAGAQVRAYAESLELTLGGWLENHSMPYPGVMAMAGPPPVPGTADYSSGRGTAAYGELDYVIFPWLVPGVRAEYSHVNLEGGGGAYFMRILPGIATVIRPNIKVTVTAQLDYGSGPAPGGFGSVQGFVPAQAGGKFEAEVVNGTLAWAF